MLSFSYFEDKDLEHVLRSAKNFATAPRGRLPGFHYFSAAAIRPDCVGTVALNDGYLVGLHIYEKDQKHGGVTVLEHDYVDVHADFQNQGLAKRLVNLFIACSPLSGKVLAHGDYTETGKYCLLPLFLESFDCKDYAVIDNDFHYILEQSGMPYPREGFYTAKGRLLLSWERKARANHLRAKRKKSSLLYFDASSSRNEHQYL